MGQVTIRQAIQFVADYPEPLTDDILIMPAHEIIARTLFDIANRGNVKERGSLSRANKARKMILDRLEGRRRAGTRPVTPNNDSIDFIDLTGGSNVAAEEVLQLDR